MLAGGTHTSENVPKATLALWSFSHDSVRAPWLGAAGLTRRGSADTEAEITEIITLESLGTCDVDTLHNDVAPLSHAEHIRATSSLPTSTLGGVHPRDGVAQGLA